MTSDPLWLILWAVVLVLACAAAAVVALTLSILFGGSARLDREDAQ